MTKNIVEFLGQEGVLCEFCVNCFEAQDKLLSFRYDCVVLDIMLPDGNGLEILKFIKSQKLSCNILIISAKNSLDDKINGLEIGADDYLTKPFQSYMQG